MSKLLITSLALGTAVIFTVLVKRTLERLGTEIKPFYEFDLSLKGSGVWSVIFYILIISVLAFVSFILSGIEFGLVAA